ncbi:MAG TPA: hypothetical protein PLH56_07115 [Candidatus Omnitrophota bacterium]|nr:hypothetical protein [Candidatus Omnitrophota bacterium]HPN89088.1 hypothetical protein [Candidatus Omnitrophota bacterium]
MRMNSSGRIVTVFIVIFVILLISLTAISMFFLQQETKQRRDFEAKLEEAKTQLTKIQSELDLVKKEKFVLEEKNKEADNRINDLSDELVLEQGLKAQMKTENASLKAQLEQELAAKKQLKEDMEKQLAVLERKTADLNAQLNDGKKFLQDMEARSKTLESENSSLKEKLVRMEEGFFPSSLDAKSQEIEQAKKKIAANQVQLDKIVIAPQEIPQGRVLSVDAETEFVIINLGEKDGVRVGDLLAVYRGKDYLGDIKVTRLQPEMAAADLLPPFSSKLVRKNDQVISK